MDNNYKVYMHVAPDNQKYIGITSINPEQRWKHGRGYDGSWFGEIGIPKYGWENIKHKILYENLTKEQAESLERQLILEYGSWVPGKGYNDSLGVNSIVPKYIIADDDLKLIFVCSSKYKLYCKENNLSHGNYHIVRCDDDTSDYLAVGYNYVTKEFVKECKQ